MGAVRRGVIAALFAGVLVLVAVIGVAVWQGVEFLHAKFNAPVYVNNSASDRQGAIDAASALATKLTTIDWRTADADVQGIIDDSTGTFHDDFTKRSGAFLGVVRDAKSVSVGTVTGAGVDTIGNGRATVLVAVTVKTTNDGAPEAEPRAWRTKITLKRDGDRYLTSNVEFVP